MRFLNATYGIEVLYGRLNLSSADVEKNNSINKNVSYVKKIGNRSIVSAQCQKKAIMNYMQNIEGMKISSRIKTKSNVLTPANPATYVNEDLFGFTRLENEKITEDVYENLSNSERIGFKKSSKAKDGSNIYTRNITKKRKARMLMSPLIKITGNLVKEFNTTTTTSESMLYQSEAYNGVMVGSCNLDIDNVSKFSISSEVSEFRDYTPEEINQDDISLDKNERLNRITSCLKGLEHLKINGNQANYLTDTSLKFIILGEFSWGNNAFQGVINKDGLDTDALFETLADNSKFQLSPIWIAVSDKLKDSKIKDSFLEIKDDIHSKYPINICSSVGNAIDSYISYLEKTYI
ncbi:MAG: hypothetical protein LKF87_14835 [Clostridium tyrobutyricum]|jgi:CRISPR-associated protein Cst2|uniref:hypothetical protein n=1 Tax=Clostridium tyrobutyricum TaxID=1519 RepID=UPI00164CEDF2|nr:hypothetical protein [Clostridium tyrobutyricum]MCH4200710.1 hypothetical protein [Clostridium tyrobutyricum]MCH4260190.1 hypothetical protein [Clostridium tyrobutyricum]